MRSQKVFGIYDTDISVNLKQQTRLCSCDNYNKVLSPPRPFENNKPFVKK